MSQFQLLNWASDPTTGNKVNPLFSEIGKAYGLKGYDISDKKDLPAIVSDVFRDSLPSVVHCHVDYSEDILPLLLPGQKMNEMYPFQGKYD